MICIFEVKLIGSDHNSWFQIVPCTVDFIFNRILKAMEKAESSDLAIVDNFYTTVPVDSESNRQFQSDAVATEKRSLTSKVKDTIRSVVSTITGIFLAM